MIPGLEKVAENIYGLRVDGSEHLAEAIIDAVHAHEERTGKKYRDRIVAVLPKRIDEGILYGFRYENSHCEVEGRSPECELYHNHQGGAMTEKTIRDVLGSNLQLDEEGKGKIEIHIFD